MAEKWASSWASKTVERKDGYLVGKTAAWKVVQTVELLVEHLGVLKVVWMVSKMVEMKGS